MEEPPPSADPEKVTVLQAMFETLSLEVIKGALDDEDGVVERAIDSLLNITMLKDGSVVHEGTIHHGATK